MLSYGLKPEGRTNNMAFEENTNRNDSMIPNTQIESMFLRVANDEQMRKYTELIEKGHISLATAYASNTTYKIFYALVERFENDGGDIETLKQSKKNGGKI
jgi:hypothetical protein